MVRWKARGRLPISTVAVRGSLFVILTLFTKSRTLTDN